MLISVYLICFKLCNRYLKIRKLQRKFLVNNFVKLNDDGIKKTDKSN